MCVCVYACVVYMRCVYILLYGRKNSLVPVPRPCVSSRMEERHSSLVHSTFTFTFYPCCRSYIRTLPASSMPSSEPAFYSGWAATGGKPMQSRVASRSRAKRFFLFPLVLRYILPTFIVCIRYRRNDDTGGNISCEIHVRSLSATMTGSNSIRADIRKWIHRYLDDEISEAASFLLRICIRISGIR